MSHTLDHRHMIVTAYVSKPPLSVKSGEDFLHQLVDLVGMKILMNANAIYCEDLGNEGVTGVVGLTTSHASFHSWHEAERPFVSFDLYSCRHFDTYTVLRHLETSFGATEMHYLVLDRDQGKNEIVEQGVYNAAE